MKQNMNPKYNMVQRMENMLRTAWKTLKRVPFMCLVRTDSPSLRAVVTASAGPAPLWSGCQAIIGRNEEEGLCADMAR